MSKDILLVGCGNMGFAMLAGWLAGSDKFAGMRFHVVEPAEALRARAEAAGARVYADAGQLPDEFGPALVFLAVKPQTMDQVAPQYSNLAGGRTVFISVAAGVTIATLSAYLPGPTPIIRCMPNTPAAIGRGMMVSYANPQVAEEAKQLAADLLAASGKTAWIDDEGLMDAVTAISGSGPAYLFHFIECMASAATALGLPQDLADQLALQTVAGAGELAARSETPPSTLRQQVTSPGGTTAAALGVLMADGALDKLVTAAARAACKRSLELGKT